MKLKIKRVKKKMKDLTKEMICRYCKNWNGYSACKVETGSPDGRSVVNPDEFCFNGQFELAETSKEKGYLIDIYKDIVLILREFLDLREEYYSMVAIWIMGTYLHNDFSTYPYLFINAMRGSGKTRMLKIIKELSWEGDMLASLSDAVMFRTHGTLCIDEFENIGSKDKNSLRELLNTAYKKGGKVKRMRKKKTLDGEEQVVEEFSTFRPIVMANIWGMEEVLGDRCLTLVLEKSNKQKVTKKVENFENNGDFAKIKQFLVEKCSLCMYIDPKNIYKEWNYYIDNIHNIHNNTLTLTTYNYTNIHEKWTGDLGEMVTYDIPEKTMILFDKIYKTDIDGRNLEITLPLLIIAEQLNLLDSFLETIKKIISEKKEEEITESKDVMVFNLISSMQLNVFYSVTELTNSMRFMTSGENTSEWLNSHWMGKALKRLNLIKTKRRDSKGQHVILDVEKALQKMEMFK